MNIVLTCVVQSVLNWWKQMTEGRLVCDDLRSIYYGMTRFRNLNKVLSSLTF